jgi:hypothetical protein
MENLGKMVLVDPGRASYSGGLGEWEVMLSCLSSPPLLQLHVLLLAGIQNKIREHGGDMHLDEEGEELIPQEHLEVRRVRKCSKQQHGIENLLWLTQCIHFAPV